MTNPAFSRRLHWQVAGLGTFEDAIDVVCGLSELADVIGALPIFHQAAVLGKTLWGDRWQAIAARHFGDQHLVRKRKGALPTSLLPSWVHTPPLRAKTEAAPMLPMVRLSRGPPTLAVLPSPAEQDTQVTPSRK
jgi:hypothetical protein